MKNLEKVYIYDNNILSILIINNYKNTPFIVYEKALCKFRVEDLKRNIIVEEVKNKIIDIEADVNSKFSLVNRVSRLLYNPNKFLTKEVTYVKDFKEETLFNHEDINRIITKELAQEEIAKEFLIDSYKEIGYVIDGQRTDTYVDKKGYKIGIHLEILVVDKQLKNELISLFSLTKVKFEQIDVIDYHVSKSVKESEVCLIDLNYEINKVFLKSQNIVKVSYLNTGVETILNKVYEVLLDQFDPKIAEELTRMVKKNWLLKKFDYQYDIIEGVDLEIIVETLQNVIFQYFSLLFSKIPSKLILEKVYINTVEIEESGLINFLNEKFDYNFESFHKKEVLISNVIDTKVANCLKKIYKEL